MKCNPSPEQTCGELINDSCVVITGDWPFPCNSPVAGCYRQSEFNEEVGTQICAIQASISAIEADIDLSSLTGCASITPDKTSVHASLQQLYDEVCALKTDLNISISGLTIPDCIQSPCETPIGTLGELLEAIMTKICDCCATG